LAAWFAVAYLILYPSRRRLGMHSGQKEGANE